MLRIINKVNKKDYVEVKFVGLSCCDLVSAPKRWTDFFNSIWETFTKIRRTMTIFSHIDP
jgi:hypothetical protein